MKLGYIKMRQVVPVANIVPETRVFLVLVRASVFCCDTKQVCCGGVLSDEKLTMAIVFV